MFPSRASSRKQTRQRLKSRMKARGRPHLKQRRTVRDENFGFFWAFTIIDFFAIQCGFYMPGGWEPVHQGLSARVIECSEWLLFWRFPGLPSDLLKNPAPYEACAYYAKCRAVSTKDPPPSDAIIPPVTFDQGKSPDAGKVRFVTLASKDEFHARSGSEYSAENAKSEAIADYILKKDFGTQRGDFEWWDTSSKSKMSGAGPDKVAATFFDLKRSVEDAAGGRPTPINPTIGTVDGEEWLFWSSRTAQLDGAGRACYDYYVKKALPSK